MRDDFKYQRHGLYTDSDAQRKRKNAPRSLAMTFFCPSCDAMIPIPRPKRCPMCGERYDRARRRE
jgi:rubrerythrin